MRSAVKGRGRAKEKLELSGVGGAAKAPMTSLERM